MRKLGATRFRTATTSRAAPAPTASRLISSARASRGSFCDEICDCVLRRIRARPRRFGRLAAGGAGERVHPGARLPRGQEQACARQGDRGRPREARRSARGAPFPVSPMCATPSERPSGSPTSVALKSCAADLWGARLVRVVKSAGGCRLRRASGQETSFVCTIEWTSACAKIASSESRSARGTRPPGQRDCGAVPRKRPVSISTTSRMWQGQELQVRTPLEKGVASGICISGTRMRARLLETWNERTHQTHALASVLFELRGPRAHLPDNARVPRAGASPGPRGGRESAGQDTGPAAFGREFAAWNDLNDRLRTARIGANGI